MIKNVRFITFIILLILNFNISASAFDKATYTNGMFGNSFFSINLGSGWTQNTNMLIGDIVTASFGRNNMADFVSINANYAQSTDPLFPTSANSAEELMKNKRSALESVGAYNSFSEDSFTTNGGYKVHILRYTQNLSPSPQHYHFFIDATSSQYSGGQGNWFAIDVDFTSTTFPSVMTGISFEEAKAIIQSIDIDNGSPPHQLNGLSHSTSQGNSSGSSNSGSGNNSNTGSSSNANTGSSNSSAFDKATYTSGMFGNSFFSINLGSGWTQNTNMLIGDIVTASFGRNNMADFVSINANYAQSTDPLFPTSANSAEELMKKKRSALESVGAYNSFSEDSFTTNGGYKVHILRYTQNLSPSPQHYHFFIDATSSQYSGGQGNWFAIDVDFTSTTFPPVMTGISFEEAKAIIQSIDIDNGSPPHQLNGLSHSTSQGNLSGSSNSGSANNSNTGSSSNTNTGSSNSSANQMLLPTIQTGILKNNQLSMEVGEGWAIEYSVLDGLDIYINDIEQKDLQIKLVNKEANKTILLRSAYIETTYREYWSKGEYYDGNGNPSIDAHYLANKDNGYPESLNNPTSAESEAFVESEGFTGVEELYFDEAKTEIKNTLIDEGLTEFTEEEFLSNQQYLIWSLSTKNDKEKASTFLIDLSEKNLIFLISILQEEYAESKKIVETFNFSSEIDFVANDKQESVFQSSGNVMSKWVESGWMGVFFEVSNGWIYHPDLGWMYAENSSGNKTWLYSEKKGWLWTSKVAYPYLYSDNSSNWVYVVSDQDAPTKAFDFNPSKWTLWQDLTLNRMVQPSPDKLSSSTADEKKVYEIINSTASNKDKLNRIAEAIRSKL